MSLSDDQLSRLVSMAAREPEWAEMVLDFADDDPMRNVCLECRVGKHSNCSGGAWDNDEDGPTACDCYATGHPDAK